jgi:potassium inwardly-rectifying channel subfamily J
MEFHGEFSDHSGNSTWIPCVAGVKTFTGVILFSIETQQTIGYGTRSVTEQCVTGALLLAIQSCFGCVLQALWAGVVYTKLAGPKNRRRTLIWSRQAVISLRDHYLTLQVRIGDIRQQSNLLEAHVRMYYIAERLTQEQEMIPLNLLDMHVGFNSGRDRLLLQWPLTIEHRIDSKSPLWLMDKNQLAKARFEILVVFEAIIETTGLTTLNENVFYA